MKKWTSLLLALAMALSLGRLRQFWNSGEHLGAAGIRQRLHNRRNTCSHRHGNARRGTGRGAVGGTCRE